MPTFARYEITMPHNMLIVAIEGLSDDDFVKMLGLPESVKISNRGRSAWSQGSFDAKYPSHDAFLDGDFAIAKSMDEGKSPIACSLSARTNSASGATRLSFISPTYKVDAPIGTLNPDSLKTPKKLFAAQTEMMCVSKMFGSILENKNSPLKWIDGSKIIEDLPKDRSMQLRDLVHRIMANTHEKSPPPFGCVTLDEFRPFLDEVAPRLHNECLMRDGRLVVNSPETNPNSEDIEPKEDGENYSP